MTTFLLIRHGENDLVGHTLAGRRSGLHLNERGRVQAATLAERLADLPITALYSSPMERAQETAVPLSRRLGLSVQPCEEINEIDFGDWTGRRIDDLSNAPGWDPWNSFRSGTRTPGGELMLEAQARTVTKLQQLRQQHREGVIALFSHGDIIKAALAYYLGIPIDLFQRIEISPASVSVLALHEYGPQILLVNGSAEDGLGIAL